MKWRNIKAKFLQYEDNKTQTGRGKLKEPPHYDVLTSFLKKRPLANPGMCVLEGGSSATMNVAALEVAASESDPDDPPTPVPDPAHDELEAGEPARAVPTPVPALAHDEVEAGEPAQAEGHAQPRQPPRAPAKTRKRLRPPTSRQEVMGALKTLGATMEKIADSNKETSERIVNLFEAINNRQEEKYKRQEQAKTSEQERHDIDMQIKTEQLKLLKCKRRKYEEENS